MIGSLSVEPGSSACVCQWPVVCDGTGWMQCLDDCDCNCGSMRECAGCEACEPSESRAPRLIAPFPYFGGKSAIADTVWEHFGNVANYVEPFFGSGAVLLARPHHPRTETVNDKECMLANFWRALQCAPEEVAYWADWPVNEADQHARHLWLIEQDEFRERMKTDPDFYDAKIAGWWVWGQSLWIGTGWCKLPHRNLPHLGDGGTGVHRQRPHLGDGGNGVHRQRPHLGNAGNGVHRQRPHLGNAGTDYLLTYMQKLAMRLRHVRVCCGDWSRVCGPSPTFKHGLTAVFLDPPYADEANRQGDLYASDDLSVAHDARQWAIENGNNPQMRIALCGYDGEHEMPRSWECLVWKARGGYGSQGNGRGRENSSRERIWFSPHCLCPQETLFHDGASMSIS